MSEAFDWRELGDLPTTPPVPGRAPTPGRVLRATSLRSESEEVDEFAESEYHIAHLEWSAPANGARARAGHAVSAREIEEPAGAHVSSGDPLRLIGLVVAAGMNVLQEPDRPGGAHVREDDPMLMIEHRAAHAVSDVVSRTAARGTHVRRDDPLLVIEHRAAHAASGQAASGQAASGQTASDAPRGAHVRDDDPLHSIERRALHAMKSPAPAPAPTPEPAPAPAPLASAAELRAALVALVETSSRPTILATGVPTTDVTLSHIPVVPIDVLMQGDVSTSSSGDAPHDGAAPDGAATAEAVPLESAGRDPSFGIEVRKSLQRDIDAGARVELASKRPSARASARRRWRLVPVAGAAGAVAAGLGGGTAVAFITTHGSGSTEAVTGSPVAVTIAATAGTADLLPGRAGAVSFTLHDPASSPATFDRITPGASVVSDNTALCASNDVTIAPTLPYTLPTPITVSPGATTGVQSVAGLVTLAPDAPTSCQGVTFTVNFTLSGRSS